MRYSGSNKRRSKRAMTLVELIVAMTLTSLFAAAVVLLIAPVERIYMHTNDLGRAQFVADTVVDAIRAECSSTYITDKGDVWIADSASTTMTPENRSSNDSGDSGSVLVIRKNLNYCETIASDYVIDNSLLEKVRESDENETTGDITSKAIYRMLSSSAGKDVNSGYVHFGYFENGYSNEGGVNYVFPNNYYDFTNPFTYATYEEFTVALNFTAIGYTNNLPSYVECDVTVKKDTETVYTRHVTLCFAAPARS